jgi:hypothetical protein
MITIKKCPICQQVKPLTDFPKSKQVKDGTNTYCKKCMYQKYTKPWKMAHPEEVRLTYKKWVKANLEKIRETHNNQQRDFARNHRDIINERQRKYYKKHPEQLVTRRLVMEKKLPIKTNCEVCGSTEKLQRHHPDYSQPFLTTTLCYICHCKTHGKLKENC